MKRFLAICLTALLLALPSLTIRADSAHSLQHAVNRADSAVSAPAPADLLESAGKITFLRVHDVGSGFGPPSDFIDVEVVMQLNTKPGMSFGFQLRNDNNRAARQGMLDLLRDAFNNNWTVVIDYLITPPKKNGVIIRVALTKP